MPLELSDDPRFARRIVRLAVTSMIMLGVIFALALNTPHPARSVVIALALGWMLMPTLLLTSLRWPRVRYGLLVPSTLVSLSLVAISVNQSSQDLMTWAGWWSLTFGVLLGGLMGVWFWFRWLPVPVLFHDPFSRARWALIVLHVALVVIGAGLVKAAT